MSTFFVLLAACAAGLADTPRAAAVGAPAPDFTLTAVDGTTHTLSRYAGRAVVLEWFNPGCPFVKHSHGPGGPLQDFAKKATKDGSVWLAINSNAPGTEGNGLELNRKAAAGWGLEHPVLLDEQGTVGRAYGAATTPHMYVVDTAGILRYRGAIDNRPLGKGEGQPVNYVQKALADLAAGRSVATSDTKPYGCSVKY
jgi:peroxiredoxin